MKRSELEQYLGKTVTITLFDNEVITGELHKTGEEKFKHDPNLYIPQKLYFLINSKASIDGYKLFKCSHVKKLKER